MTMLWLVRHGVTDWNQERRYQGHSDPPLNAVGDHQAQCLADRLSDQTLNMIYSSDLQRAVDTATLTAADHHLEIQMDVRLREMNFGLFEGLTYDAIQAQHTDIAAAWFADPDCPPIGGERLSDMAGRVKLSLDEMLSQPSDDHILIVAHGGSLRVLLCHLLGIPPNQYWRFDLKPCAITQIKVYDGSGILMRLNDDAHLRETA